MITLLMYLWAVPSTVIGFALLPFYTPRALAWQNGAIVVTVDRAIGNPDAQTIGFLMMAVGDENRAEIDARRDLWRHENKHVKQVLRWGLIRDLSYGLEFAFRFAFNPGYAPAHLQKRWQRAYHNLHWERQARKPERG